MQKHGQLFVILRKSEIKKLKKEKKKRKEREKEKDNIYQCCLDISKTRQKWTNN